MNVYLLLHKRKFDDGTADVKIIGFYSSIKRAKTTINKYKGIVGFKDYPKNFVVKKIIVRSLLCHRRKVIKSVYFLQHEFSIGEIDIVTRIGVFLYKFEAQIVRMLSIYTKDFKKHKNGFTIDKYIINMDNWTEGFVEYESIDSEAIKRFLTKHNQ